MKWSRAATELFELLLRDVPAEYKESQRRHALQEVERHCEEARIREVGSDQVVVGYIRATPTSQRMALRNQMRMKGVFVEKYDGHFFSP